ncbi:hypothetical protein LO763_22460 [Glycomyces sp. A-F 0318]|uniref:hypothetical protein n=1 Tax=Glycomyces amatae TaxID=2881355 RepID=UPI001E41ED69|nr:hypothetical protein [Glycomyces amatae]MCD0446382.1 hypothetical protein [Glycomyces amatae]
MTLNSASTPQPGANAASAPSAVDQRLGGWTHGWAAAATELYNVMAGFEPGDFTAIGRRDVLALLLVSAARNVERGAAELIGEHSAPVKGFAQAHPSLKVLRDRIEHFDEYIRGTGRFQTTRGAQGLAVDLGGAAGLDFHSAYGGGSEGHTITFQSTELDNGKTVKKQYVVSIRAVTVAVRALARDTLSEAGQLDDEHLARCPMCQAPERI